MDGDTRDDLVIILAGLVGIVTGQALRRWRGGRSSDTADRFTSIGISSLAATPALGRIAGDVLHVDRDDVRGQAILSFCVGAVLALFADEVGRYLPGGPLGGRRTQD